MRSVDLPAKALGDYEGLAGSADLEALRQAVEPLEGLRVLHVNSTSFGGGVAEILASLVPLMRDVGVDAHWKVLEADERFFWITKTLHNGLQGSPVEVTEEMAAHYRQVNEANAADLGDDWDVVVVHDPQPLPLAAFGGDGAKWVWRCHIDPTTGNPQVVAQVARHLQAYDVAVFSLSSYAENGLGGLPTKVIHPSIDPLTPKNGPLPPEAVEAVAARYGVDPGRPTVSAVARFDPWKDPLGVLDVYRTVKGLRPAFSQRRLFDVYRSVKGRVPDLQLLLIASMAHDDPEGWEYYERTLRRAGEDPDVFFLTNLRGVGGREVNAFQRLSQAALVRSRREGFGLVVSESLWKRVPVVGTPTGGIPLQIVDGRTGYLVEDARAAADRLVRLLRDPGLRRRLGEEGRAHVQRRFLITRNLRDYVDLLRSLVLPDA